MATTRCIKPSGYGNDSSDEALDYIATAVATTVGRTEKKSDNTNLHPKPTLDNTRGHPARISQPFFP